MGNRNHGSLLKKITAVGLACLLLVAGLPLPAAAAESCKGWKTAKFFESATVDEVRACLSAGRDPNEQDTKGLTALHRAARDTADPAVIEVLLEAGANPRASSIAGRTPWDYARTNSKIKGSDAWQRLRIGSVKKADWSRVQAVAHNTRAAVWLYNDEAPRDNRKIKGRFHSASADSITLVIEDGQTRTFQKSAVRKVLTRLPFRKRGAGWATLVVASVLVGILWMAGGTSGTEPGEVSLISTSVIGLPTLIAFLGAKMGSIYNVPPKHRTLPQGDQQSGDQGNA